MINVLPAHSVLPYSLWSQSVGHFGDTLLTTSLLR